MSPPDDDSPPKGNTPPKGEAPQVLIDKPPKDSRENHLSIQDRYSCLELKIWIKVGTSGTAKNLPNKYAVEKMMVVVKNIWKCPGQCCIQVVLDGLAGIENPVFDPTLPKKLKNNDPATAKGLWDESNWPGSSGKRVKVAFVDGLENYGGLGVTQNGNIAVAMKDGDNDRSIDDMGETLAHELGHAMGLAIDDDEPLNLYPLGLTGHSVNPDNLMGTGIKKDRTSVRRDKLNKQQCERARLSPLLIPTIPTGCKGVPDEKTQ